MTLSDEVCCLKVLLRKRKCESLSANVAGFINVNQQKPRFLTLEELGQWCFFVKSFTAGIFSEVLGPALSKQHVFVVSE